MAMCSNIQRNFCRLVYTDSTSCIYACLSYFLKFPTFYSYIYFAEGILNENLLIIVCGKWTDKITAAGEGTDVISSAGVIDGG